RPSESGAASRDPSSAEPPRDDGGGRQPRIPLYAARRCGTPAVMTPEFLAEQFAAALSYDAYLQTGTDEQRRRWTQVYDVAKVSPQQRALVETFTREMKLLCI